MHLQGQASRASAAIKPEGLPAVARLRRAEAGFALAAMLVAIAVLSVLLLVALPTWRHQVQREKEAELIFRGEQYARAISLYQRKLAGAFPPSLDALVEQKFLRKRYKDPITNDDFEPVFANSAEAMSLLSNADVRISADSVTIQPGQGGSVTLQGNVRVQTSSERPTMTFQSPRGGGQPAPGTPPPAAPGGRGGGPIAGIVGVRSKSTAESIRLYNGRDHYDQWIFVYMAAQPQQPGQVQQPGVPPGRGGTPPGRGASTPPRGRGPF